MGKGRKGLEGLSALVLEKHEGRREERRVRVNFEIPAAVIER